MIVHYLEGTFLRNGDLRPPPQARDPCKERRRDHIGGRGFGGNGGQGGQGDASGLSPVGVAKGLLGGGYHCHHGSYGIAGTWR